MQNYSVGELFDNQTVVYRIVSFIQQKFTFGLRFEVLVLLTGETNIFEMTNSIFWHENENGQLNTVVWSTFRCNLYNTLYIRAPARLTTALRLLKTPFGHLTCIFNFLAFNTFSL